MAKKGYLKNFGCQMDSGADSGDTSLNSIDSGDSIEFYRVIKMGDKGTEREWKNLKEGHDE
jgi:hypothetical protein